MKIFTSILVICLFFSCTKEATTENEKSSDKKESMRISKIVNTDDNTYWKYNYNSENKVSKVVNEKNEIIFEYDYNSQNLVSFIQAFEYEEGVLIGKRLFYYSYDDQNRQLVRKREKIELNELVWTKIDSTSYENNKIVSKRYIKELNLDGLMLMQEDYTSEYFLNDNGFLESLKSKQIIHMFEFRSELTFFYDENNNYKQVKGTYEDNGLTEIDVSIMYTDIARKPQKSKIAFLNSTSSPLSTGTFIGNLFNDTPNYTKEIKWKEFNNNFGSLYEYEQYYDYTFDDNEYPIFLKISSNNTENVHNTKYEWEKY